MLASLLQWCRSTEANHTLHDVWLSPGLVNYIYIFGGSCPVMEFCSVQNSVCIQLLHLLYWQRHCTALQQWASAKLCDVEKRTPPIFGRVASTFGIGPHSSFVVVFWFWKRPHLMRILNVDKINAGRHCNYGIQHINNAWLSHYLPFME